MDIEPKPTDFEPELTPEAMSDPAFYAKIKEFEQVINESPLPLDKLRPLINNLTDELEGMLGREYTSELVDVIGEAYACDEDGEVIGEEVLLSADDVVYIGIDIVRVQSLATYKVVFRFVDIVIPSSKTVTDSSEVNYCMTIENCIKLTPSPEAEIDNEYLLTRLAVHANHSEDILQASDFAAASASEQRKILNNIANETSSDVMAICADDVVAVEADSYDIISFTADGPVCVSINQTDIPAAKCHMPIGTPAGCTFKECITMSMFTHIHSLERDYPSLKLHDQSNGIVYLVPIRAIRGVRVVVSAIE